MEEMSQVIALLKVVILRLKMFLTMTQAGTCVTQLCRTRIVSSPAIGTIQSA